jgi:hypothetical protein
MLNYFAYSNIQDWDIYIDQSKASLDRGGGATLDAFCGLVPPSGANIIPAILPKSNKKGPWVRCISNVPGCNSLDVSNVDSVDKVHRVLTKHLKLKASYRASISKGTALVRTMSHILFGARNNRIDRK